MGISTAKTGAEIKFEVDVGNEAMRIDTSGNVGIGTATPARDLVLYRASNPDMHFVNSTTGATDGDGTILQQGGLDFYLVNQEAGDMFIGVNNSTDLTILDGGNVGIGTTSPVSNLNVIVPTASAGHSTSALIVAEGTSTGDMEVRIGVDGSSNYGWISAVNKGTGVIPLILNGTGGNVGIGTTSPDRALHLYGSSPRIKIDGSSGDPGIDFAESDTDRFSIYWDASNDRLAFRDYGTADRMVITEAGNVGIGHSAPTAKLTVGGGQNDITVRLTDSAGSYGSTYFSQHYTDMNNRGLKFYADDASTAIAYFRNDGVVTIAAGTVTSDERLKENISDIVNPLTVINSLRGRTFEWIDNNMPSGSQYGLIAQELESVVPDLVSNNGLVDIDGSPCKSTNVSGIIPILIEAVKELSAKVEALENA